MWEFKVGVFSDTHVGRNIPRIVGDARRRAFRHAFRQAIDAFIEAGVDYVLHGGDVLEKRSMTPEDAVFVKEELYRLVKESEKRGKHVQILAVRGNHDGSPTSNALDFVTHPLADYFKILGEKTFKGEVEAYWDGRLRISAMGYHPYARGKLEEVSETLSQSLKGDGFKIFFLHNYVDVVHDIPPQLQTTQS